MEERAGGGGKSRIPTPDRIPCDSQLVVAYERMNRRIWILVTLAVAVVLGAILIPKKLSADRDEAAFQAQLRLARAEGIPTNWREFAATIPTATPSENAAALYRALKPHHKDLRSGNKKDTGTVDVQLIFHPSVTSEADASAVPRGSFDYGRPWLALRSG
jgi:hypothetical protein